jgi:ribosomal protein S18 acetylase RimI-like enzyme
MPLPEMIRIDEQDWEERRKLLADGWREIEVLETWCTQPIRYTFVRPAAAADLPEIARIAFESFTHDRLHKDPNVSDADASFSKVRTVLEAFASDKKKVFVSGGEKPGKRVSAFLVLEPNRYDDDNPIGTGVARVDLIAVDRENIGEGHASSLIQSVMRDFGINHLVAGTQMHNEPAKKLYESLGMSVVKRERTFHR